MIYLGFMWSAATFVIIVNLWAAHRSNQQYKKWCKLTDEYWELITKHKAGGVSHN